MKTPSQENLISASDILKQQRTAIRQRREALSPQERQRISQQVCQRVLSSDYFHQATEIALYLAAKGEVEAQSLIECALEQDKRIYLPALDPEDKNRMHFVRYQAQDKLILNRFGMPEPELAEDRVIPATKLDLVLCPLVAFDEQANRIGMGGGFYDRYFAFKNTQENKAKDVTTPPLLVGLAYDFQKVRAIEPAPWDVPMSAVVSEKQIYLPHKNC
jgi:5-formyltetrahydrofolate cyclo-ligase